MCTVFWKLCFRSHRKHRSLPSFRHSYIPPYLYPHHRERSTVSLRLGHATALTVHRTVIHYRVDTALPLNHSRVGLERFCGFFHKPLSHGRAVTAPLKGRLWWVCRTRLWLRLERSRIFCNRVRLYDTMSALVSGGHRRHLK